MPRLIFKCPYIKGGTDKKLSIEADEQTNALVITAQVPHRGDDEYGISGGDGSDGGNGGNGGPGGSGTVAGAGGSPGLGGSGGHGGVGGFGTLFWGMNGANGIDGTSGTPGAMGQTLSVPQAVAACGGEAIAGADGAGTNGTSGGSATGLGAGVGVDVGSGAGDAGKSVFFNGVGPINTWLWSGGVAPGFMKTPNMSRLIPANISHSSSARACISAAKRGNRCVSVCPALLCSHSDSRPTATEANNNPSPKDSSRRISSGAADDGKSNQPSALRSCAGNHLIR